VWRRRKQGAVLLVPAAAASIHRPQDCHRPREGGKQVPHRFLIVGAGGFAKEVADMVRVLGGEVAAFFAEPSAEVRHPVGSVDVVDDLSAVECDAAVIAIGDTATRMRLHEMLVSRFSLPALVHPSASVSPGARLGDGVLVMQNVVVSADAEIGTCAAVNVGCYVAHDCRVGAYSHLAASTNLGGGSSVGMGVFCGTSTVLLPGISVGDWSVTGAGAVVTSDVPGRTLVAGVPARTLRTL